MRVAITGSSGLIGSALIEGLRRDGHEPVALVRRDAAAGEIRWNPQADFMNASSLAGMDAVVHLAGENIAGRWTEAKKRRIRESRIPGTRLLATALASMKDGPRTLVSASAIGYYGDRGDTPLDESSSPGEGFLPQACVDWEEASHPATNAGIRVVNLRLGIVLSGKGGALAKMLTPFRLGLGGRVGSGRQYWSWIALEDVVEIIKHACRSENLVGPVNAVVPKPVTNLEFTSVLGHVLHRPTVFPMPAFAARLAFGEMADALLLASARVEPRVLRESGYEFRWPELQGALEHVLR
jgi:uncharacterized protein (TIGR01777 family)